MPCLLRTNIPDRTGIEHFPEFLQPHLKIMREGWIAGRAVQAVEEEGHRDSVRSASFLHDESRSLLTILGLGLGGHAQFPVSYVDNLSDS